MLLSGHGVTQGTIWTNCSRHVESTTENFENVGAVVSSKLIELRKPPSSSLVEEVLKLEAFKNLKQDIVSTTVTESQMTICEVFEGCVKNATCSICSKKNWFESHQLCYAKYV